MDDDAVGKALTSKGSRGSPRSRLFERMMSQWTPIFLTDEYRIQRNSKGSARVEGVSWRAAEGIMQAIEEKLLTNEEWLAIQPVWEAIYTIAERGELT